MSGRFPILSNDAAWAMLPKATSGAGSPLPTWARITAATLPRTTANILELEDLHRAQNPLGPRLRALTRWMIANANRCESARAVAAADLKRTDKTDNVVAAIGSSSGPDQGALATAYALTKAAHKVGDLQIAALLNDLGEVKLTAFVQLIAFGNFQDRLLLAFGIEPEEGADSLPPSGVRFQKPWVAGEPRVRPPVPVANAGPVASASDPEWRSIDFASLQKRIEGQRGRTARIRIPSGAEAMKNAPDVITTPSRIEWSRVCFGYSPALATPWTRGLRTFAEEAKQDRVFEESLFWVITRELQCFY